MNVNVPRNVRLAGLALALVVSALAVLAFGHRTAGPSLAQVIPPPGPGGGMAVDCDAGTPGIQADCFYPSGATFNVQVQVTAPPPGGYIAFQAKLRWTDANHQYLPAADPADEALWPECDIPARADNQTETPPDPSVLFACVQLAIPPALPVVKTAPGAVLQFQFQCQADGITPIELVPLAGDPQRGSQFIDPASNTVEPVTLDPASVNCGIPLTPTPTTGPATPGPTATATVAVRALAPTGTGDDVAGDNPGRLWLLMSGLAAASAAGLAFFGWRYVRSRR